MKSETVMSAPELTAVQWESVCEHVDGRRAAAWSWERILKELAVGGVPERELEQLQRRYEGWARKAERVKNGVLEMKGEPQAEVECAELPCREDLKAIITYLFNPRILVTKPRWAECGEIVLRDGDVVRQVEGPVAAGLLRAVHGGPEWLVCAVVVESVDGTRQVYPECRLEGGMLYRLAMASEELDASISRRVAALLFAYHGAASGIASGQHLARVCKRTRQSINEQQTAIRERHWQATGSRLGLAGQVPTRGRRSKS